MVSLEINFHLFKNILSKIVQTKFKRGMLKFKCKDHAEGKNFS